MTGTRRTGADVRNPGCLQPSILCLADGCSLKNARTIRRVEAPAIPNDNLINFLKAAAGIDRGQLNHVSSLCVGAKVVKSLSTPHV